MISPCLLSYIILTFTSRPQSAPPKNSSEKDRYSGLSFCENDKPVVHTETEIIIALIQQDVFNGNVVDVCLCDAYIFRVERLVKLEKIFGILKQVSEHTVFCGAFCRFFCSALGFLMCEV